MTQRTIGIGVVGAGRMGSTHARLLSSSVPGARLAGIADLDLEAARRAAAAAGGVPAFGSLADLLAAPGVDAVLVATSSSRHLEAIRAIAAAGRHILCEKPLALTVGDCDEAIQIARAAGVRLQVGFMRRWDPDYRRAHDRIASGALGRPVLFSSIQFDPAPPPLAFADRAVSGGIMVDMGIHEFDLARWLMGDEVVEVLAYGASLAYPDLATVGDVDSAVVALRFAGGATGTVALARATTYGEDVRTEVLCTGGSVWWGLGLPTTGGAMSGGTHAQGVVSFDTLDPQLPRFERAYAAQATAFARGILDDGAIEADGADGRAALRVAIGAAESMRSGRPVAVDP